MTDQSDQGARRDETQLETIARGKATRTPLLLAGGVAALVWSVAGLLALAGLLIWLLG